ncbi:MAG: ATP-binding cassette domain-containing protein [Desulfobacterales bacterium]|nr:ATP-binding cassette domain-containing protein [Desulfobacterales bacterium]
MPLVELSNYTLEAPGAGNGLKNCNFTVSEDEIYAVHSDNPEDAHLFLKALATLERPKHGTYRFNGQALDFTDYRKLLPFKYKIGYVAWDASLIGNRTVRENLLFSRYYFENSLSLTLDEKSGRLCNLLKIETSLEKRPSELNQSERKIAITIRELMKAPDLLLIEFPEDLVKGQTVDFIFETLTGIFGSAHAVVLYSYDEEVTARFSNKSVSILNGIVTVQDVMRE